MRDPAKPSRLKHKTGPAERSDVKGQKSIAAAQNDLSQTDKYEGLARHRKIKETVMVDGFTSTSTYLMVARKTADAAVFIAARRTGTDYRVHFHPNLEAHSENVREIVGESNRKRPKYESKWMSHTDFVTLCDLVFKDRSYAVLPTPEALKQMGVNLEGQKQEGWKNVGRKDEFMPPSDLGYGDGSPGSLGHGDDPFPDDEGGHGAPNDESD